MRRRSFTGLLLGAALGATAVCRGAMELAAGAVTEPVRIETQLERLHRELTESVREIWRARYRAEFERISFANINLLPP